jgi:hypothetical protein
LENLNERNHYLEGLGIDMKMIIKLIIDEWYRRWWYGFIWLRIGATGKLCGHTVNLQVLFRVGNFLIVISYNLLTIFAWRSVVGQSFSFLQAL